MNNPLGRAAGNALEVQQAIEVLNGGGPKDVVDLTVELATQMLDLVGISNVDVAANLNNGKAAAKWEAMIKAQGGDLSQPLATARHTHQLTAGSTGVVTEFDALAVGIAAWRLGAGRSRKEDTVQAAAGVTWNFELGQQVNAGDPIITLHSDDESRFELALDAFKDAVKIEPDAIVKKPDLILGRIGA